MTWAAACLTLVLNRVYKVLTAGCGVGSEKEQCREVPEVLPNGQLQVNERCGTNLALEVYNNLEKKTVKIYTERSTQPDAGSGFFVRNGDEVVTAGHVVKNSNAIKVEMPTGEVLDARITKYDDINDLALLKIEGLGQDPKRAVAVDGSKKAPIDDVVFSVGTPGLTNTEKVLSVGVTQGTLQVQDVLARRAVQEYAGLKAAFDTGVFDLQNDATNYVLADRIRATQGVLGGQSGSLLVNTNAELVGVVTDNAGPGTSLSTPVSKVAELLNDSGKFDFKYSKYSNVDANPVGTLAVDAAIGATMLPYVNRVAPALYGVKRAFEMPGHLSGYNKASEGEFKSDLGRLAAEDAAFGAGGIAMSIGIFSKIPKLKYAGMAAFGLAALSTTISDFDDKHLKYEGVQRKDGTNRQPFMWNFKIDGRPVG